MGEETIADAQFIERRSNWRQGFCLHTLERMSLLKGCALHRQDSPHNAQHRLNSVALEHRVDLRHDLFREFGHNLQRLHILVHL